MNRRLFGGLLAALVIIAVFYLVVPAPKTKAPGSSNASTAQNDKSPSASVIGQSTGGFDKSKYPLDEASSLWVIVNKGRRLPADYVPAGLTPPSVATAGRELVRSDTASALEDMFSAAAKQGLKLEVVSGYRSYSYQQQVYGGYVRSVGTAGADTFSARPGSSEHQTGLAADLGALSGKCQLDQCFGDTPEGKWLAANCYKFGFIIRYPKGKDSLTGYEYEPWHVRYVGKDLAAQINKSQQTLEQFFGLPAYATYPVESLTLKE